MKKKIGILCLLLLLVFCFTSCENETKKDEFLPDGSVKVYHMNNSQTGIDWEAYKIESKETDNQILELLGQLSSDPENFVNRHAINDAAMIKEYSLDEGNLLINFDSTYTNQKPIEEALVRAALVKTLTQIQGVDYVEFYVNGTPLTDSYENAVGQMTEDDFIDDDNVNSSYIPASITLYFSTENGKKLAQSSESKMYDGSITMEQHILLRLIEGPDELEQKEGMKATIPADTILNNVTTKEGVCYVDFSKEFLAPMDGVSEKVSIYSVVNSLVELNNINKVQIMIDGKMVETYRDSVELDVIFERNLDIVEGTK